ncbi:MAG TPA: response regulator transcription factor [Chitinophagaceae bacterium]|nr:response regulator transcription factor [Chitinophagaceae bacterium]
MKKITILITDDHTLIRQTWSLILNADPRFEVVGEAGKGEQAVELAKQLRPNVVIMDINLPGINGIEATQLIRKFSPATRILGVSMYTQPSYVTNMLKQGAIGYVTKNSSCEEMYKAIIETHNNRRYICDEIKSILSEQVICGEESRNGFNSLSSREIEIIGFIRKGYFSKEIADLLMVSVKTVEVHRYNILKKLNVKNTAAMVNYINSSQLATGY